MDRIEPPRRRRRRKLRGIFSSSERPGDGFGVAPAASDDTSIITVTATVWTDQFNELWALLVPGAGSAPTQQGEAIRLAGKLAREVLDNGAINWSADYRRMVDDLTTRLTTGTPVAVGDELTALGAAARTGHADKTTMYRLTELAVGWVLANPHPIPNPDGRQQ